MENQNETPKRLHDFSLDAFKASINAMIASLAMVLSSITVILNALRLKRFKVEK